LIHKRARGVQIFGANNRFLAPPSGAQNGTRGPIRAYAIIPEHVFNTSNSYTLDFNSWLYTQEFSSDKITTEQRVLRRRERVWKITRKLEQVQGTITSSACAKSANLARNRVDFQLCSVLVPVHFDKLSFSNIQPEGSDNDTEGSSGSYNTEMPPPGYDVLIAETQMDETVQGKPTQDSEKQQNTIITRDEGVTSSTPARVDNIHQFVSSEPMASYSTVTDRFIPMDPINVRTEAEAGTIIKRYDLPKDIFLELPKTANMIPFETYIYSNTHCHFKFVTNANKFHCGKIICSVKFDSAFATGEHSTIENALCRPHIILDLSANNEGNLAIPFRFRRALMRNLKHNDSSVGVTPSYYASLYIQVFSRLSTGVNGIQDMYIRPFVRFYNTEFAGMSYRAEVQMIGASLPTVAIAGAREVGRLTGSKAVKGLVSDVEALLNLCGNDNCDKPTDARSTIVVPHPRVNFASGVGVSDSTVLRLDPTVMTPATHIKSYESDPTNMLEIARIWGLRNVFRWSKNDPSNSAIAKIVIDPTSRTYDQKYTGTPTPLEYVCSMYNFWSGTIEMRFDFVSNSFHTGAVMVCVEFGRPTDVSLDNLMNASSTYTQTFHLGEQKSLHVTIPYI